MNLAQAEAAIVAAIESPEGKAALLRILGAVEAPILARVSNPIFKQFLASAFAVIASHLA